MFPPRLSTFSSNLLRCRSSSNSTVRAFAMPFLPTYSALSSGEAKLDTTYFFRKSAKEMSLLESMQNANRS